MAEIIKFEKNALQYRQLSVQSSERGNRMKALLYARKSAAAGGTDESVRLADALYESGNFEQAADVFLSLYFDGVRTREIYAGLLRCFFDMSRVRTAEFFINEGVECGALSGGKKENEDIAAVDLIPSLVFEYPFRSYSVSAGRLVYPIKKMLTKGVYSFLSDISITDIGRYRYGDMIEDAFAVIVSRNLNKRNAKKMLEICDATLVRDPDNISALAGKVEALAALGRLDEAEDAAEEIQMFEMPGDVVELIKCALAMSTVGDHDGVCDYAEELLTFCEEETLLLLAAASNANAGDYLRAKELYSYVLRLAPKHPVATYYARILDRQKQIPVIPYTFGLPKNESKRRRAAITQLLSSPTGTGADETLPDTELLIWALTSEDADYAEETGVEMIRRGLRTDLIMRLMRSCAVGIHSKRLWLVEILTKSRGESYNIFLKTPMEIKTKYFDAVCSENSKRIYFTAFSAALSGIGPGCEKKLYSNFISALPALENSEVFIDAEAAAAALILQSRFKSYTKSDAVSELFDRKAEDITSMQLYLFGKK